MWKCRVNVKIWLRGAVAAVHPSRIYLQTSLMLGRLPYINRKVRKTREASHIAAAIETIMITILSINCHNGSVPVLSFITAIIGAVIGNSVKMVKITWSGLVMNKPISASGITDGKTMMLVHWLLSRAVEPMEPMAAQIIPNSR